MSKRVIYNIVDSVKGGCGKSTFAIMLAMQLFEKYQDDVVSTRESEVGTEDLEPNTCLIDMDLQGTSLQYLFSGKDHVSDIFYLNDQVLLTEDNSKSLTQHFNWDGRKFDAILCNPEQKEKNRYRSISGHNYSPEIMCSTFRNGFHDLIQNRLQTDNPYRYEYVIMDMPPNSDGYSDAAFDCMKSGNPCNLFLVQTLDIGQRFATNEYFGDLCFREDIFSANKIIFVYNDYLSFSEEDNHSGRALFENAVALAKDKITSVGAAEEFQRKIYFVALNFSMNYYRICTEGDGIINAKMPADFGALIKFLYRYDGLYLPAPKMSDLISLMNNEKEDELGWVER